MHARIRIASKIYTVMSVIVLYLGHATAIIHNFLLKSVREFVY